MLLKIDEKKEKLLWELGFLAVYAVLLTQYFINTTVIHLEIPYLIPNIPSYRLWIRLFAITFVVLKTARDERFSWKELIFCGILIISFGRCAQVAGYMELVDLAVLIIGARNVDYKKILMLYCGVSGVLIVGTVGASLVGVVEDWVFDRWGIQKHSFGFLYPNEFGAHVFFFLLAYTLLRHKRISIVELGMFCMIAAALWKYSYAKTNAICIVILAIGMLIVKGIKHFGEEKCENWLRFIRTGVALLPLLLCVLMISLTIAYNSENKWLYELDQALNGRLQWGKNGFNNYGVKLFGQYVQLVGRAPETDNAAYNFLDCSYVTILIRFGIASFFSVGMIFWNIICKALKKRDLVMLGVIAVCFLQCVMEHHLHEIAYNPLMVVTLCSMYQNGLSSGKGSVAGKHLT